MRKIFWIVLIGLGFFGGQQVLQAQSCDPAQDYLQIGETAFQVGDFAEALAAYDCLVELNPVNPRAYNRRGWTAYQMGNYRAAWADFDRAIALDPSYPYAYNNRGLVYHYWGDYAAAVADFEQAIALNHQPLSVPQGHLARTLDFLGQNPTATPSVSSEEATPSVSSEEATLDEALRQYRAGDYEGATSTFSMLNQTGASLCHRGYMYMAMESYDYAKLYFDQSIQSNPCVDTIAYRAYTLTQLGEFEAAAADYRTANVNDLNWMGYLYLLASYPYIQDRVEELSIADWYPRMTLVQQERLSIGEKVTVQMVQHGAFLFPIEGETTLSIIAQDAGMDVVDVMIVLLDPNGLVVGLNDDSELGFDSLLKEIELPEAGEYTLIVTHAGGGWDGLVEVWLEEPAKE